MSLADWPLTHDDLYDPWRDDPFAHLLSKLQHDLHHQEEPLPFAKAAASKTNERTSLSFEPSDHIQSLLRRAHPHLLHSINPWCGLRGSRDTDEELSIGGESPAEITRGWDEGSILEHIPADDFTSMAANPSFPPQVVLGIPGDYMYDGPSCARPRPLLPRVENAKQMSPNHTLTLSSPAEVDHSSVEPVLAAPADDAHEGASSLRPLFPSRVENAQRIPPRRTPRSSSQRTVEPSAQRSATRSVLVAPADRAPDGPSSSSSPPPSQGEKRKRTEEIVEVEKRETKKRRTQNEEGAQGEEEPKRTTDQGNQIAEDEVDLGVHGIINRGGKKLECTYCDKFFANGAHAIVRHVQSNRHLEKLPHEIRDELSKAAKLHCEHCNKEGAKRFPETAL
ncbi:hypothetical protein SCP_0400820 [Sparassis crispa]|uniref:C2H2-type domain-containing protein n=1 Tax=Sparassis crispa TaxID=139825 RepID=A0A401GHW8_9APHY|nr:hypothetical protein SCP_0400820 [Sparassis crispa]GBE81711.1 hypothetical protein SCP_0400820 [Sparassis crispa]